MRNIHDMYKLERPHELLQSYQKLVGTYIFCRAREDNATRLFIDNMRDTVNAIRKDGWWDTFTIVDGHVPQQKGLYLCKIKSYYLDVSGFINSVVTPIVRIPDPDLESGNEYLRLFATTGYFSEYYRIDMAKIVRYNIQALYREYDNEYQEYLNANNNIPKILISTSTTKEYYFSRMIFDLFISGKITISHINELLQTKFPIELLAEDIQERYEEYYKEKYPTFYSEIQRKDIPLWNKSDIIYYLESSEASYERMRCEDKVPCTEDPIRKCELVREYYVAEHKRKREEKAAERKNKKKSKSPD